MTAYFGLTESELLAIRSALLAYLTKVAGGESFSGVTVGGKSFTRFVANITELRDNLAEVNAALQEVNPDTYGARITRTTARFF